MSGNVGFVSEAENFKLSISLFVNKTYSCCKKSTTEAGTERTGCKHKQGFELGRGNEAVLCFQHFCWRQRLAMISSSNP